MPAATVGGCGEFVLPLLTRFHKYEVWVKLNFVSTSSVRTAMEGWMSLTAPPTTTRSGY